MFDVINDLSDEVVSLVDLVRIIVNFEQAFCGVVGVSVFAKGEVSVVYDDNFSAFRQCAQHSGVVCTYCSADDEYCSASCDFPTELEALFHFF